MRVWVGGGVGEGLQDTEQYIHNEVHLEKTDMGCYSNKKLIKLL